MSGIRAIVNSEIRRLMRQRSHRHGQETGAPPRRAELTGRKTTPPGGARGRALLRMGLVLLADGDTGPPSRPQRHDRRLALALADSPVPLFQILATPDAAAYGRRRLTGFCTFATRRVGRNDRACGTRRSTRAWLPHGVARRSRIPGTPDIVSWKIRACKFSQASAARPRPPCRCDKFVIVKKSLIHHG